MNGPRKPQGKGFNPKRAGKPSPNRRSKKGQEPSGPTQYHADKGRRPSTPRPKQTAAPVVTTDSLFSPMGTPMRPSKEDAFLALQFANNDKAVRDQAVRVLYKSLAERSDSYKPNEMMAVWKGLFYCLWMSDKPPVQVELATNIVKLTGSLKTFDARLEYLRCGWATLVREWSGLDKFRIDKFYALLRRMLRRIFTELRNAMWDDERLAEAVAVFAETFWDVWHARPIGPFLHYLDLWVEELERATKNDILSIPSSGILALVKPWLTCLRSTNLESSATMKRIESRLLIPLFDKLTNAQLFVDEDTSDTEIDMMRKSLEVRQYLVLKQLGRFLLDSGSSRDTPDEARDQIYKVYELYDAAVLELLKDNEELQEMQQEEQQEEIAGDRMHRKSAERALDAIESREQTSDDDDDDEDDDDFEVDSDQEDDDLSDSDEDEDDDEDDENDLSDVLDPIFQESSDEDEDVFQVEEVKPVSKKDKKKAKQDAKKKQQKQNAKQDSKKHQQQQAAKKQESKQDSKKDKAKPAAAAAKPVASSKPATTASKAPVRIPAPSAASSFSPSSSSSSSSSSKSPKMKLSGAAIAAPSTPEISQPKKKPPPSSEKRVVFDLQKNRYQSVAEHRQSVRKPQKFDLSVVPESPALKKGPVFQTPERSAVALPRKKRDSPTSATLRGKSPRRQRTH